VAKPEKRASGPNARSSILYRYGVFPPDALRAISPAFPSWQILPLLSMAAVMAVAGTLSVCIHPCASVTDTRKTPTDFNCVEGSVEPVLQRYV
jgi:hypothetical protein